MGMEPSKVPLPTFDRSAQGFSSAGLQESQWQGDMTLRLTPNMHEVTSQAAVWVDDKVIERLLLGGQ